MSRWLGAAAWVVLMGCAASKPYNPQKKYSPQQLQEDYRIFRGSLEESHPSLYWYTPKDSMDYYFGVGQAKLKDSLTEVGFRYVLAWVAAKMRCGHTSIRASEGAAQAPGAQGLSFPLYVKAWPDTTVVTVNLNRTDSNVIRGTILKTIDGRPMQAIIDSMFSFLSADGYNTTHKYQTLSNGATFRSLYGLLFGLKRQTPVEFIDTLGQLRTAMVSLYNPRADTPRVPPPPRPKISRRERKRFELLAARRLRFDTVLNAAILEVNSFVKGNRLRRFFRQSFKEIRQRGIKHLVVDLRGNGGGNVVLSNLLTKYIADKPFVIADSLYAVRRGSAYAKYRNSRFFSWVFLRFFTNKQRDGKFHFGLYEGKAFKPKRKNHFEGTTYILTGGNTFSAASLVAKSLVAQEDVLVVGEETGGGAYGNTAWLISEMTLPNTGVRYRLPLFRLVIDKDSPKGYGVQPEVLAVPTVEAIRKNIDYKMEKVRELIKESNSVMQ